MGHLLQLQAGHDLLADLVELEAQAVALVGRALDESVRDQGGEEAVDGALAEAEASGQLDTRRTGSVWLKAEMTAIALCTVV